MTWTCKYFNTYVSWIFTARGVYSYWASTGACWSPNFGKHCACMYNIIGTYVQCSTRLIYWYHMHVFICMQLHAHTYVRLCACYNIYIKYIFARTFVYRIRDCNFSDLSNQKTFVYILFVPKVFEPHKRISPHSVQPHFCFNNAWVS